MIYLSQYQKQAAETAIYPKDKALEYLALGLVGEAGEVANKIKKVIRDGTSPDSVIHELGDVLWQVAAVAKDHGWMLSQVAEHNLEKLSSRQQRDVIQGSGDTR